MSLLARTLKGSLGFLFANVVGRGSGFLFIILSGRLLDVRAFGLLTLGLTIASLTRKIFTFGIPNTVQRFLSGKGTLRTRRIYGSTVLVTAALALAGTVALFLATPLIARSVVDKPDLIGPLRVLSGTVGLGVVFTVAKAVLQSREHVASYAGLDTAFGVVKVGLVVVFVSTIAASATAGAWAVLGAYASALGVFLVVVPRLHLTPSFAKLRASARRLVSYSAPLLVVGIGYYVAKQADRLMLGALDSAESVGLYTAASTLALSLTMVHSALGRILMPIISESYVSKNLDTACRTYLISVKWVSLLNGITFLLFVGWGQFLLGLFGTEYATTVVHKTLSLLGILYFIGSWVGSTGAFLQMTDGHRWESANTVAFVVINIGLNYICIQWLGLLGAAVATTASGLVRNGLQVLEMVYLYDFNPVSRTQLKIGGVVLGGALLLWEGPPIQKLIVGGSAALALFFIVFSSVDDRERELGQRMKAKLLGE